MNLFYFTKRNVPNFILRKLKKNIFYYILLLKLFNLKEYCKKNISFHHQYTDTYFKVSYLIPL